MVAIAGLDLIVAVAWLGLLTGALLVQAILAWVRYRDAASYARHAARLAEATTPEPTAGRVIELRPASAPAPASTDLSARSEA